MPLRWHMIISKWENLDCLFLYPCGDTDHSQNLMGSKSSDL